MFTESSNVLWKEMKPPIHNQISALIEGVKARHYRPLMDRPKCEDLESRISHFVKRGRIDLPHLKKIKHSEADEQPAIKPSHKDSAAKADALLEQAAKRVCMSAD